MSKQKQKRNEFVPAEVKVSNHGNGRFRPAFTLIELLVVIAIIAILMSILFPALNRAKEQGKRAVCLNHMKTLVLCWIMYADDNEDRIVNGEAYIDYTGPPQAPVPADGNHKGEQWWVGNDCAADFGTGGQRPQDIQIQAIRAGALFKYCKNERIYRCPTGIRGEMRTYSIVDSMNGLPRNGTWDPATNVGLTVGKTKLWVKKRGEIIVPGPSYRLVFIDEGRITPDSYAVNYLPPIEWWDPPYVRHSDGTNVSYADGHSDYWKWRGIDTIKNGKLANPVYDLPPTTPEGKEDLKRVQIAVWGKLGY